MYGTRYGATRGVAERMAEWLNESNIDSTVINIKKDQWPDLSSYNGLIIGSGIKIGQWTKEMKNLLNTKKEEINTFSGPKVFFVCSGYAAIPEKYQEIKEEYCKKALEDIGVNVDNYEAFGGIMDVSKSSKQSWVNRQILRVAGKENPEFNPKGINDSRDWDKIEEFTQEFIQKLQLN